jgi:hypothetical protein
MRELEAIMRAFLSLIGWVRALSRGPGAVGRRVARRSAHRALARRMQ